MLLEGIGKFSTTRVVSRLINFYEPNKSSAFRVQKPRWKTVRHGAVKLVVNVNEHIGFRYLINKKFDNTMFSLAQKFNVCHRDIILDVGANIGAVTVPVCVQFGCAAICIEASKKTASRLLVNLSLNDIRAKVIVAAAVSPDLSGGDMTLNVPRQNVGAASVFREWHDEWEVTEIENVRTMTLDEVLSKNDVQKIRLVKIDVEGGELGVLQGARRLLQQKVPVVFEYVNYCGDDEKAKAIRDALPSEYELWAISEDGILSEFSPLQSYRNVIAVTKQDVAIING